MFSVNFCAQGFPLHVLKDVCELSCKSLRRKHLTQVLSKAGGVDHRAERSRVALGGKGVVLVPFGARLKCLP